MNIGPNDRFVTDEHIDAELDMNDVESDEEMREDYWEDEYWIPEDDEMDCDDSDDGQALASAGFGTDEDYGYFGDEY